MGIPWTGTGGLFTRMGCMGRMLRDLNLFQQAQYQTDFLNVVAQYGTEPALIAALSTAADGGRQAVGSIGSTLKTLATNTVNTMIWEANAQSSRTDILTSLKEVIAEMQAQAQTVQACTVTIGGTAGTSNTGTGVFVGSTKRGDGLVQENTYAETAVLTCTADARTGGATSGNETFRFAGDVAQTNTLHWEWPLGSGASTSFTAIDGTKDNSSNNLLTNSGFETFVANAPSNWTIITGTAGTNLKQSTGTFYSGAGSLQFVGDGATLTSIAQQFNSSSTGTAGTLLPDTVYHGNVFLKLDATPGAGALTIDLIDGTSTVVNDDQGTANSYTVTLSAIPLPWAAYSFAFRTPKLLPSAVKIRLRLSTALSSGSNLFIDHFGFGAATKLYSGGPYGSVFSGSTAFLLNDSFSVVTTNDRGKSYGLQTFQTLFARLFAMMSNELLLPSSASPTITDSLFAATPLMDFTQASNSQYVPLL